MKSAVVFLAVLAAGCLTVGVRGQRDVSCAERLLTDVHACFSKNGLESNLQSGQQDATTIMRETQAMDPSAQCDNLPAYKGAINCSLNVLRECLKVVNMGSSIPDSKKLQEGMEVVCQRQDEFDSDCLKTEYPRILSCGQDIVKRVVQERSDSLTMEEIICLSADVNYDCAGEHLQNCGKDTLEIYLEQLNRYQVPSACISRPPGRPGRENYVTGSAVTVGLSVLVTITSLVLHLLPLH